MKGLRVRFKTLAADSAAFAWAPQATTLTYAARKTLAAAPAAFAWSPQASTLTYSPSGSFAWQIADNVPLSTAASTSVVLATGVSGGAISYFSPDPLPGQTLSQTGGTLSLVNDSTVPSVPTAMTSGTIIEVMDSPFATIVNVTKSITYAPGTYSDTGQGASRWSNVMVAASHGDIIEISPGYVHQNASDVNNYYNSNIDSALLSVWKLCTIRNMAGRGRWRIWNGSDFLATSYNGICLHSAATMGTSRGDFTIEGFEIDNWGSDHGLTIHGGSETASDWSTAHNSLTVRNFKIGKPSGTSASGIGGSVETMTLENGHIYDIGAGGQDHNLYITADTMTLRGLHLARTRGWVGTPWNGGHITLEGHLAKVSALNATVEGCVFDLAAISDASEMLQMKQGGNWIIRGNLFIDSQYPNVASGAINMCKEYGGDGSGNFTPGATTNSAGYSIGATSITLAAAGSGALPKYSQVQFGAAPTVYMVTSADIADVGLGTHTITITPALAANISATPTAVTCPHIPNFQPFSGRDGNSLLFERNVFVGHYPRPILWFFDPATLPFQALHSSGDATIPAAWRLAAITVRDNIAMVATTAVTSEADVWKISGWASQASTKPLWIYRDPNSGLDWGTRGNKILTYDVNEAVFAGRSVKEYRHAPGPITANNVVTTKRFVYPHGYVTRADSFQGLG